MPENSSLMANLVDLALLAACLVVPVALEMCKGLMSRRQRIFTTCYAVLSLLFDCFVLVSKALSKTGGQGESMVVFGLFCFVLTLLLFQDFRLRRRKGEIETDDPDDDGVTEHALMT